MEGKKRKGRIQKGKGGREGEIKGMRRSGRR